MTIPLGYKLVFNDDFDSDLSNWNKLDSNIETWMTCRSSENSYIENGNYVSRIDNIVCPRDATHNARSGGIISKQSWLYGYFEIRAKVAAGTGINSSFWMMRTNWSWPPEIDIYETAGYDDIPDHIYMTIHWDTDNKSEQNWYTDTQGAPDFSLDYHIFAVDWTSDTIKFYIDDMLRSTMVTRESMKVPMGILLTIGKGWINWPLAEILPKYHYVDYVKVYQRCPNISLQMDIL